MTIGFISPTGGLYLNASGAVQLCCCEIPHCGACNTGTTPRTIGVTLDNVQLDEGGGAWCGNGVEVILSQQLDEVDGACLWKGTLVCGGETWYFTLYRRNSTFWSPHLIVSSSPNWDAQGTTWQDLLFWIDNPMFADCSLQKLNQPNLQQGDPATPIAGWVGTQGTADVVPK